MRNKKAKSPKPKDAPLTEEEYDEMASEEGFRHEQERHLNYFNQFDKPQLIQLLMEAQDWEDRFSGWLLLKEWSMAEVKLQFDRLRREKSLRTTNLKKGRQAQVRAKVAASTEAQALGVDDYYGLLRKAITQFDQEQTTEEKKQKNTKYIREIIVDQLCEKNYSRHTHDKDKWTEIVRKNVSSKQIDTARTQLKNDDP
jgi:hypothetical protein